MNHLRIIVALAAVGLGLVSQTLAAVPDWHFEPAVGTPNKLVWQTTAGTNYYLFQSGDMKNWTSVATFPQVGTGGPMEYSFVPQSAGFFRIFPAPDGFAPIPAGTFLMGDQSSPLVGYPEELPVHSVFVSAYFMAKYEVTKSLWDDVWTWAISHNYTDLAVGGGKASNHPVQYVTWYDVVKWCNARSEKDGLTPCYTVSGATYRTLTKNSVVTNWTANGYRLPTEAEWEKAARGGLAALNFPWGNTINQTYANFYSNTFYSFESSQHSGHHPTYATGSLPYTAPVGSFAANGYGLYDMAGNVAEWCWDWQGAYAAGAQTDPHGSSTVGLRLIRGGSWFDDADTCRNSARYSAAAPNFFYSSLGFRVVRAMVP